jgi:hypothetical protein
VLPPSRRGSIAVGLQPGAVQAPWTGTCALSASPSPWRGHNLAEQVTCSPLGWSGCQATGVTTFILTWDGSESGYAAADYSADIATTAAGRVVPRTWTVGVRRRGTSQGDRVFLLRQGTDRGIVASGSLADGTIVEDQHWADPARTAEYTEVDWDRVLSVEDRLHFEQLTTLVPGHHWNAIMASGQELRPPSDTELADLWTAHLATLDAGGSRWTLVPGETLGRQARMEEFGGAMQGGIQPSKRSPNVFVYSDPQAGSTYGYNFDGWTADGTAFLYTGEGRTGDQRMRSGNAAVLNHREAGRALRLFVADGTEPGSGAKIQRYVGEFMVSPDDPYLLADAPDQDRVERTVIVFRLRPVGDVLRRDEDSSAIGDAPEMAEAQPVDVDTAAVPAGSAEPVPIEALSAHEYPVAGSTAATAVKREAELVQRFQSYLEKRGSSCVRYKLRPPGELRTLFTDLFDGRANMLYEAKGVATREAVRMAVGQLLDYSRHMPTAPGLGVLLPTCPTADLLDLLSRHDIRCVYEVGPGVFADA